MKYLATAVSIQHASQTFWTTQLQPRQELLPEGTKQHRKQAETMANPTEIPPDTLQEVDDFISDLVRAKLVQSLSTAINPRKVPGNPDSHSNVPPQGVHVQGPLSLPSVAGSATRPQRTQDVKKPNCSCKFCRFRLDPKDEVLPDDTDLEALEAVVTAKANRSLALLVAAHEHSADRRHRDPREWMDWYSQLFAAVVGISTLGAGFTFTIVFSGIEAPQSIKDKNDEAAEIKAKETIRTWLAVSWMLFVFSIGLTSTVALLLSEAKGQIVAKIKRMDAEDRNWIWDPMLLLVLILIALVQCLPIVAFLASAEALRQYHNRIGLATLVGTGVAGALIVFSWCFQNL